MGLIEILGYLGALFIGLILGLLGGGGSILTVPVLVYVFALNPITATAYSLFVVGISGLGGVIKNLNKGLIAYRVGIIFSIPSLISVYLTRKFLVPAIPENLIKIGEYQLTRDVAIMLFFGIIMLIVALTMIGQKKDRRGEPKKSSNYFSFLALQGLFIGVLTGIIGAGGGFLIIPALVLLANLSMKRAVATSLFIIAIKSLIGFIGDIENMVIDWYFLLSFTFISLIGLLIGVYLSQQINGQKLKKIFGYFVLFMGVFIIIAELVK